MITKHLWTSEEKLKGLGYGEWVEEPDEVQFVYKNTPCLIKRVIAMGSNGDLFGGHLCGYVTLPLNHPWGSSNINIDCEVHGGITHTHLEKDGRWIIGFDCAHSNDVIPSMIELRKELNYDLGENPCFKKIKDESPYAWIFKTSYRNIKYVEDQCLSLVDQSLEIMVRN